MSVIILRGISGAGKSTWATQHFPDAYVISADNYFIRDGKYLWDANKLGEAHAACLLDFLTGFSDEESPLFVNKTPDTVVVVDNTNITVAEIAPYVAISAAYGEVSRVLTLRCDPEIAAVRNIHSVSLDTCRRKALQLISEERHFPRWWDHTVVSVRE